MNLLLDTQAFLWFISGDPQLSNSARASIENIEHPKLISVVGLWEMAIKVSLGKLRLKEPFESLIPRQIELNGFGLLPVQLSHVVRVVDLPFHHRDPFDRLMAGQCLADGLSVVSRDSTFDLYGVSRIW